MYHPCERVHIILVAIVHNHVYGIRGNDLDTVTTLRAKFVQTMPGVGIHEVLARLEHKAWAAIHRGCAGLEMTVS